MCGSTGNRYRDLISACIVLLNFACWSKNGYFSVWDKSGVVGIEACIFCFECET